MINKKENIMTNAKNHNECTNDCTCGCEEGACNCKTRNCQCGCVKPKARQ